MRYLKSASYAAVVLTLLCSAAAAQQPFVVKWANDRISVKASSAPLADVIGEVAKLANVEVIGLDKLAGPLSADIADQDLEKALSVLLEGVNYSIGKRPSPDGSGPPKLVLRVLSMARAGNTTVKVDGPLHSPALDMLVAEAMSDDQDQKESDADDDPDYEDDVRNERNEAAKLAAEGKFGPKADVEELMTLMGNYNDFIRVEALKALAARPIPTALTPLAKALGDECWEIRTVAVDALARLRDAESLARVGELLMKSDDDPDVQVDALRVLAQRAQPESLTHLRGYMKAPPKDQDGRLREAVQQMIAEFEWRASVTKTNPR
jgi:hypothetical protein